MLKFSHFFSSYLLLFNLLLHLNSIFFIAHYDLSMTDLPSLKQGKGIGSEISLNETTQQNIHQHFFIFSSPVRKYRKNYCSHPGVGVGVSVGVSVCVSVGVGVGVAQMLKFLVKVFIRLYLLNMLMDQVDTLHVGRYWSEVLFCTIMTHLDDLEVKVTDLEILC